MVSWDKDGEASAADEAAVGSSDPEKLAINEGSDSRFTYNKGGYIAPDNYDGRDKETSITGRGVGLAN